jgi:hypothetical protein
MCSLDKIGGTTDKKKLTRKNLEAVRSGAPFRRTYREHILFYVKRTHSIILG